MLKFELVYAISIWAILVSILLSVVTCMLSARKGARKAAKMSPIDAIRESEDIKIKNEKIKSPKIIKKIFGIGGDIAYKNLKRNRKKYRTTIISIVVCVSVFIVTSSFVELAFKTVKVAVGEYDYNLSCFIRSKDSYQEIKELATLDGINKYAIVRRISMVTKDLKTKGNENQDKVYYIDIYSVGEEEYNRYLKQIGLKYEDCKDKAILVNKKIITEKDEKGNMKIKEMGVYNNKKGDLITTQDLQLEIVDITMEYPMAIERECLLVSDEYMDNHKYELEKNQATETKIYIDATNADDLEDEIEKLLQGSEFYTDNISQQIRSLRSMYTLIAIFLYGFIGVVAIIGITNIFNTITTSMELRAQEFAMLKSTGMTKKEFNKMIRLESFFYGTKSLLIGIPIGLILSYAIYKALYKGVEFAYILPTKGIIISLIAVFLLIWSIMKFSLNKINKQNIIETIRRDNI